MGKEYKVMGITSKRRKNGEDVEECFPFVKEVSKK